MNPLTSLDPIGALLRFFYTLLTGKTDGSDSLAAHMYVGLNNFYHNLPYYAINFFAKYAVFSFFISIALIVVVAIYSRRFFVIRQKIKDKIIPTESDKKTGEDGKEMINLKWQLVQKHVESENQADWKLAILEADIMLADLLESMSLPGESIGEKLKAVEKSDFETLEQAWEAHKIRNAIAHEGSDFMITQREVKRITNLYKQVFDEFEMI